jgi:putative FmdB family regulatory protein
MPLYSYRCTECMNMHDIRHDFNHVNKNKCNECGGELCKFYGNVVVAASCMPTRSFTDFDATRLKERNQSKDMPAYKRLVEDGLQPPTIDGSAHLERHAHSALEVTAGHAMKDISFKKEKNRLQEAFGPD